MKKLFRTTTVPLSLDVLLKGQLRFLAQDFNLTAISGAGKELEKVKEREQVKTHAIEMQRNISPLKDFIALVQLYLYFKKEKPSIVHSITPKAGLLTMVAGKLAGVPVRMHTFTGLIFPTKKGLMQKLLIAMDRLLCSAATHVYPEGNGVKNDLINYRITSKPLKVLANGNVNGIDLEHFNYTQISSLQKNQLRKELNISENDFVFIFVGRLVGDKGINELIAAFKVLKKQGTGEEEWVCGRANDSKTKNQNPESHILPQTSALPTSKLLLVGPFESVLDPLNAETLKEIENNPDIISVGFQHDVRPYFAISNCLAFPSYREGFPNVVMQAGAMGLPAIVSDINGCNEIIKERENGLIIPVKNSLALQEAMRKIREDLSLYNLLKNNARPMIESRYEQQVVWAALQEEYQRILDEKKR